MISESELTSILPYWKTFVSALGYKESTDNYQANNNYGYYGRYQFGLDEINYLSTMYNLPFIDITSFLANSNLQDIYMETEIYDIYSYIKNNDLMQYVGQNLNNVPISIYGLIAGAHLGGKEGLNNFLTSNFKLNPSDVFGTSISYYINYFSEIIAKKKMKL